MKHSRTDYKVAMDWWVLLGAFVVLVLVVFLIPALYLFQLGATWFQVLATAVLVFFILYLVDSIFFTYYQLTGDGLVIVSQMKEYVFPYRTIVAVRPVGIRGLVSFARHKRFALSFHAYEITVEHADWKSITISPASRDIFMNTLMEKVDKERSARASK